MMASGGTLNLAALRGLLAIVIAFCLTLAPLTTASGAKAMHASAGMAAAQSNMPDCHKAKHHHHGAPANHDCCGDHSKSKCPDEGCGCIFKCGAQTLAVFAVQEPLQLASAGEYRAPNSARPPGLRLVPPGPPPRA